MMILRKPLCIQAKQLWLHPTTEATLPTGTLPHLGMKEIFQTITTMGIYSSKSIEELRLEDYNLKRPQYSSSSYSSRKSTAKNWTGQEAESLFKSSHWKEWIIPSPSYSQREQLVRWRVVTDAGTEDPEAPLSSTSFSFTPSIKFISEADPAQVFTPPQPPAAGEKDPLSTQLSVSEGQQLRDSLLETIVKCIEIQNSLYRLVLLKLQTHVTAAAAAAAAAAAGQTDADSQLSGATDLPSTLTSTENDAPGAQCTDSATASLNDAPKAPSMEGSTECLNDSPRALLCELKAPIEALMRCADIQRELFQRLVTVNLTTTGEGQETHIDAAGVNMVAVQADLEEIAFKNRMECSYARNPFSSQRHFQVSTSEDVIQHVTTVRDKNPFCVGTAVRQLPHGHGNLKTVTGKLLYSGKWRKGKRHGKGEGLIVSSTGLNHSTANRGFYCGGWKHNMRHGHGKMMFSSGAVYLGQWQFDKMTGYGVLKLPDGAIQRGTWRDGFLHGCALYVWPHGAIEYREYDAGRGQPFSWKVRKQVGENLLQMSSIRSQLLTLRECVLELKDEKRFLTEELNMQKKEHAETTNKIMTTLGMMQTSFIAQRKKDFLKHEAEYGKKLQRAAESELQSAERVRELEKSLEQALNAQQCQICFERPRDCIIMPCTHLLYCRACVNEHKRRGDSRCPTCRGPISGEILCNVNP